MVSSSHDDHAKPAQGEPALLLTVRNSQDLVTVLSIEEPENEYCLQLQSLQECVCDLLIRNQQLRMALMKLQGDQHGDKDGADQ